jgi:hypothetical protein
MTQIQRRSFCFAPGVPVFLQKKKFLPAPGPRAFETPGSSIKKVFAPLFSKSGYLPTYSAG